MMRSLGKHKQLSEYWGAVPPARQSSAHHCQMNIILPQNQQNLLNQTNLNTSI